MKSVAQNGALQKKGSMRNKVAGAIFGAQALVATAMMTFATTNPWGSAQEAVNGVFSSLESTLYAIVAPIAGCALIFCLIMMMVSQNQKKVETYRAWCITIVIAIVAIFAVPFIIKLATDIGNSIR